MSQGVPMDVDARWDRAMVRGALIDLGLRHHPGDRILQLVVEQVRRDHSEKKVSLDDRRAVASAAVRFGYAAPLAG